MLSPQGRALVRAALREIAEIERTWAEHLSRAGLSGPLLPVLRVAVAVFVVGFG